LHSKPSLINSIFCGQGFVLAADIVPHPFDSVGLVHTGADFGRPTWTQAVQEAISIYEPAVQYTDREWVIFGQSSHA